MRPSAPRGTSTPDDTPSRRPAASGRRRLAVETRLDAVESTGLLTPGSAWRGPEGATVLATVPELERVARLAARTLDAPVAQVNLLTVAAQVPVAAVAADGGDAAWRGPVGFERSYCQHAIDADAPLIVPDAREHAVVCHSLATAEGGIVGYLSVPLRTPAGEPVGTVCVVDTRVRDWTPADVAALEDVAAVAAEVIARRTAEARARTLADAVAHVLWTNAPDGRITSLNRRWYEYTGQPTPAAAGAPTAAAGDVFGDAAQYVHPDDRPVVRAAWREHLPGGRHPGEDFSFEYRLRGRDGCYRWHLGRVVARHDLRGAIAEWVGTGTDVQDAHEAEARFRAAQELAPTGFMLAAAQRDGAGQLVDFVYSYMNAAAGSLLGRTPADVVGRPMDAVFPSLRASGLWDAYAEVLATGVPYEREVAYPHDGVMATAFHVTAVRVGDGVAVGLVNVSERAAALEAAEQARAAAEAANTAKAQFLASMSHELRTPLNAIGGYAQLLALGIHGPVTSEQQTALARVTRAQHHLLGLINDILNYAKLESGRVEYALERMDVRDVVAEVTPLVEPQVAARGLAFVIDLPPRAHVVWADREKLRQVLLNLLSNAVKFTEPGGRVSVDVATRVGGREPEPLTFVRVRDTGIGIPRDKQDAIFEPFVQVRAGLTRAHEGTGLGLAISRDLARGMGGDLRVRSREGSGSTFTLALRPAGAEDSAPPDHRTLEERWADELRRAGDDRRAGQP